MRKDMGKLNGEYVSRQIEKQTGKHKKAVKHMKKVAFLAMTATVLLAAPGKGGEAEKVSVSAAERYDMSMIPAEDRMNYEILGDMLYYHGIGPIVYVPDGVDGVASLGGQKSITECVFNNTAFIVDDGAFLGTSIKKIHVPNLSLVGNVFNYGIEEVTVAYNNKYISVEGKAIYSKDGKTLYAAWPDENGTLIIKEGVEKIDSYTFAGCAAIKKVVLPKSLKTIGHKAFFECINLKSIEFSDGLELIDHSAFSNCTNLESVIFPKSLKIIEISAFENCTKLSKIVLNDGLEEISNEAFRNCALTSISFPDSVTEIGYGIFEDNKITNAAFPKNASIIDPIYLGNSIERFVLPNGIKEISPYAFLFMPELKYIEIPKSVKNFGEPIRYYIEESVEQHAIIYLEDSSMLKAAKAVFPEDKYTIMTNKKEYEAIQKSSELTTTIKRTSSAADSVSISWEKTAGASGYIMTTSFVDEEWQKQVSTTVIKNVNTTSKTFSSLKNEKGKDCKLKTQQTFYVTIVPYIEVNGKRFEGTPVTQILQTNPAKKQIAKLSMDNGMVSVRVNDIGQEDSKRIKGYQVYAANKKDGEFKKVATSYKDICMFTLAKGEYDIKIRYFDIVGAPNQYNYYAGYSSVKTITVK